MATFNGVISCHASKSHDCPLTTTQTIKIIFYKLRGILQWQWGSFKGQAFLGAFLYGWWCKNKIERSQCCGWSSNDHCSPSLANHTSLGWVWVLPMHIHWCHFIHLFTLCYHLKSIATHTSRHSDLIIHLPSLKWDQPRKEKLITITCNGISKVLP